MDEPEASLPKHPATPDFSMNETSRTSKVLLISLVTIASVVVIFMVGLAILFVSLDNMFHQTVENSFGEKTHDRKTAINQLSMEKDWQHVDDVLNYPCEGNGWSCSRTAELWDIGNEPVSLEWVEDRIADSGFKQVTADDCEIITSDDTPSSEPVSISCVSSAPNLPTAPVVNFTVIRSENFHFDTSSEPAHLFNKGDWLLILDVKDSK